MLKDNIFRNMYFSDRLFYLHYSTTLTVENILFDNVSTETNFLDIEYAQGVTIKNITLDTINPALKPASIIAFKNVATAEIIVNDTNYNNECKALSPHPCRCAVLHCDEPVPFRHHDRVDRPRVPQPDLRQGELAHLAIAQCSRDAQHQPTDL